MEFKYEELKKATGDFAPTSLVGIGGFGKVYRCTLRFSDVAIKVLSDVSVMPSVFGCFITQSLFILKNGVEALGATTHEQLCTEISTLTE